MLTLGLTGKVSPYKKGFGPFAPEVYRIPFPYCYRCPFGLKNSGTIFMATIDKILKGLVGKNVFVYIDDILILSENPEDHIKTLRELFSKLMRAGLKLKPRKCRFFAESVIFCGHKISPKGLEVDADKVEAIKRIASPKTLKSLQTALGLFGYYRKFVDKYSDLAAPLYELLQQKNKYVWTQKHEQSFAALKDALCHTPCLQFPDYKKPFIIQTDASKYAISAILAQKFLEGDKWVEHPISFQSRVLTEGERKLSAIELELMAIYFAIKKFRPFIYDQHIDYVLVDSFAHTGRLC